jgi:hypothetical protein
MGGQTQAIRSRRTFLLKGAVILTRGVRWDRRIHNVRPAYRRGGNEMLLKRVQRQVLRYVR